MYQQISDINRVVKKINDRMNSKLSGVREAGRIINLAMSNVNDTLKRNKINMSPPTFYLTKWKESSIIVGWIIKFQKIT